MFCPDDGLPWTELDWPPEARDAEEQQQEEQLLQQQQQQQPEPTLNSKGLVVDDSAVSALLSRLADPGNNDTQCMLCGRVLSNKKRLRGHLMQHVTTKPRPYSCSVCGFAFPEYSALYRHMKVQHKHVKPYVCQTCGQGFRLPSELKTHAKEHRSDTGRSALYMCHSCGRNFAVEGNLQWHMSTVHANEADPAHAS